VPLIRMRLEQGESINGIGPSLKARAQGAVVGVPLSRNGGALGLLLLRGLLPATYPADHRPRSRADRGALARVAADRAADSANRRAPRCSWQHADLRTWRRRRGLGRRLARIEAGLLNSPEMVLVTIAILLIGALTLWRIGEASAGNTGLPGSKCGYPCTDGRVHSNRRGRLRGGSRLRGLAGDP
jgi:hypothetical protein